MLVINCCCVENIKVYSVVYVNFCSVTVKGLRRAVSKTIKAEGKKSKKRARAIYMIAY